MTINLKPDVMGLACNILFMNGFLSKTYNVIHTMKAKQCMPYQKRLVCNHFKDYRPLLVLFLKLALVKKQDNSSLIMHIINGREHSWKTLLNIHFHLPFNVNFNGLTYIGALEDLLNSYTKLFHAF